VTPAPRVGQGVDVHAFSRDATRPLLLGGVRIPNVAGLAGHSDADVVLHAVVDALLGAAALGDLGMLFGSDDPAYAGASSRVFVDEALRRILAAGWVVGNVDCTVVAQRPRLGPHRAAMAGSLARMLRLADEAVSVKATTTDGLGVLGRGEGIACLAVAMLLPHSVAERAGRTGGRGDAGPG
jgi:2-C-methyl-D-erythritol 2,4-cyclodiphosphate synthase